MRMGFLGVRSGMGLGWRLRGDGSKVWKLGGGRRGMVGWETGGVDIIAIAVISFSLLQGFA